MMVRTAMTMMMGVLAVMLLSGCASVALSSYRGVPVDADGEPLVDIAGGPDREPVAVWISEDRFAVTHFGGSSSCQPHPISVTAPRDQEIEIAMFQPWCPIATADMSSTTYELEAPATIDWRKEVIVTVEDSSVVLAPSSARS